MTSNGGGAPRALDGVRVIDLTHHIAGPYCTKLMADYGADVIKIERPDGGDPARRMGPFFHDEPNLEGSGLFLHLNTNKRSVTLNLKSEDGRSALLKLARDADMVIESFAPRVMPSLGLSYDVFKAQNPKVVMTSISNFGQTGPYRDYAMSEITLYALGGTMHSTGVADREPLKLALTAEQVFAGMVAATATMGAFIGAITQGEGQYIDLSLMELIAASQDRAVQAHTLYQYSGVIPARTGGTGGNDLLPRGVYPVADGYVQLFTLSPVWDRLCRMIERPDLITDPYFTAPENFSGNPEVKAEFEVILFEWLLPRTKQEIMEKAQAAGYFCGAINNIEDVYADPNLTARGFFATIEHPHTGPIKYPGAPFIMSETPWRAGRAPLLGEHTAAVLSDAGYSSEEIARMRNQGAI